MFDVPDLFCKDSIWWHITKPIYFIYLFILCLSACGFDRVRVRVDEVMPDFSIHPLPQFKFFFGDVSNLTDFSPGSLSFRTDTVLAFAGIIVMFLKQLNWLLT